MLKNQKTLTNIFNNASNIIYFKNILTNKIDEFLSGCQERGANRMINGVKKHEC